MTDAVKLDKNVAKREEWSPWVLIALNNISSKEAQINTISDLLTRRPFDDTKMLISVLKELFETDQVSFRSLLREEIYHKLPATEIEFRKYAIEIEFRRHGASKNIAKAVPQRILVLSEIIQGWGWNHQGNDAPALNLDAEECFKFLCVSYNHFFLKKIRSLLMKYLNGELTRGISPFWEEDCLGDWIKRDYFPSDLKYPILHALVDILSEEEAERRLTDK